MTGQILVPLCAAVIILIGAGVPMFHARHERVSNIGGWMMLSGFALFIGNILLIALA